MLEFWKSGKAVRSKGPILKNFNFTLNFDKTNIKITPSQIHQIFPKNIRFIHINNCRSDLGPKMGKIITQQRQASNPFIDLIYASIFHPFCFSDYMAMSTSSWCDWLYAPRDDGNPRALRFLSPKFGFGIRNLIEQIKKVYLN
jgi:hypothetical protein